MTTEQLLSHKNAYINTEPANGKFSVYISNQKLIPTFFSHEADRFSSAAFESLMAESVKEDFPRSTGWTLIRAYYSAFFAAHSLMRIHGWACTRVPPEVAARLNKDAKLIFPNPEPITAGLYLLKTSNDSSEIEFESIVAGKKGSHEALWSELGPFFGEVTDVILHEPVDTEAAQDLVRFIAKFNDLLKKNGGALWLTQVRNRVNYSHAYGAWHPYSDSTCDTQRIADALKKWKQDPSIVIEDTTKDELLQFCEACAFLVSLCRTTMEDLVWRSSTNSPFRLSSGRLLA